MLCAEEAQGAEGNDATTKPKAAEGTDANAPKKPKAAEGSDTTTKPKAAEGEDASAPKKPKAAAATDHKPKAAEGTDANGMPKATSADVGCRRPEEKGRSGLSRGSGRGLERRSGQRQDQSRPRKAARVHDRLIGVARGPISTSISVSGPGSATASCCAACRTKIIEISPEFRDYEYVVVRDEIIIVEPRTKKVVEVIRKGGGESRIGKGERRQAQAQRQPTRAHSQRSSRSQRAQAGPYARDGSAVPDTVRVRPIPGRDFRG